MKKRMFIPLCLIFLFSVFLPGVNLSAEPDSIFGTWVCVVKDSKVKGGGESKEELVLNKNGIFMLEVLTQRADAVKKIQYIGKWRTGIADIQFRDISVKPKDGASLSKIWKLVNWPDEQNPALVLEAPLPGTNFPAVHTFMRKNR